MHWEHWRRSLACLLLCFASAYAQRTAETQLEVCVTDPNGAVIAGASVMVRAGNNPPHILLTDARGLAIWRDLPPGNYTVQVNVAGFKPYEREGKLTLRRGLQRIEVRLALDEIRETQEVRRDTQEERTDPRGSAFTRVLDEAQIALLPDDPDEMERVLKQMAGPGATIRINGFRGGKLPPKSQIRQIRFRLSPYTAEEHNEGFAIIDVITKPALGNWHGTLGSALLDESLNARNAFAPVRGAEQLRRFSFTLDGPLRREKTGLFLSADSNVSYTASTIYAALPEGIVSNVVRRPQRSLLLMARVEHALTRTHTLRAEYQRSGSRMGNLGVGGFDLPDRAYNLRQSEQFLRLSDQGPFGKRLFHEFRLQVQWQTRASDSLSNAPAILVLNAFNRGGAGVQSERRTQSWELVEHFDWTAKAHAMRAGWQWEREAARSNELRNGNGTFTFASLSAFAAGQPSTYTKRTGGTDVRLTQQQFGWYGQDDWRVRKNLSVSLGLRHEVQTQLRDYNNFAPRFGLAWSPFKQGGTTVRGGAGIYYEWFSAETAEQLLRVNGTQQREIVILNPSYPDPLTGGNQTVVLPTSRLTRDPSFRLPYLLRSSISVEQQLGKKMSLFTDLRYERGVHLLRSRNLNAPLPSGVRPQPEAGNLNQLEATANSWLRQLHFGLGPSPASGLRPGRVFWFVNYVLTKATNETEGAFDLPANNYNLRGERGPASTDIRHRLAVMAQIKLLFGFRYGSFFNVGSAAPYNITTGFDDNGDGVNNDRPAGLTRNSARGTAQWDVSGRLSWSRGFGTKQHGNTGDMRPVAIALPGPTGGAAPSGGAMPGSLSLEDRQKRFQLQFSLQVNNLFNRINYTAFSGVRTSPFFGQPIAAASGRRMELGMSFGF